MIGDLKEVYFSQYCNQCEYKETSEVEDPCNECLKISGRPDSHKPQYFKEVNNED